MIFQCYLSLPEDIYVDILFKREIFRNEMIERFHQETREAHAEDMGGGDWNFVYFPYIGNVIIQIDYNHIFRGVGIPPASMPYSSQILPLGNLG